MKVLVLYTLLIVCYHSHSAALANDKEHEQAGGAEHHHHYHHHHHHHHHHHQQQQQQQHRQPQVIRSVNPSARLPTDNFDSKALASEISPQRHLVDLLRPQRASLNSVNRAQLTESIDQAISNRNDNNLSHIDKRSWSPRFIQSRSQADTTRSVRQEEVVNLLLEELATLDIDPSSGTGSNRANERHGQQQQQATSNNDSMNINDSIMGQLLANNNGGGQQALVGASAGSNRLRGRSTFLMGSGGPQAAGANQLAPSFRVGASALDGGVNNFPKRTSNRHVPCFFNAITCF